MKEGQTKFYNWSFNSSASPAQIWPYLSDTNKILRKLGATSIKETATSKNLPNGYLELSHDKLNSYSIWTQPPFSWEYPYRFSFQRIYKIGFLKNLDIRVEITPNDFGSEIEIKLNTDTSGYIYSFFTNLYINTVINKKLREYVSGMNVLLENGLMPYEINKPKRLHRKKSKKLKKLTQKLYNKTKRKRITDRLIDFIIKADDEDLVEIHPYELAEYWGEKKYSILNVFLHATKLNLLDFSWNICCPECKSVSHNFRSLQDARGHLLCELCDHEFSLDLNKNTHLVFTTHPSIRKVFEKNYCLHGPGQLPYRFMQQYLEFGSSKYPQLELEEGTYHFRSNRNNGLITLYVRENGTDNISIHLNDNEIENEEITISTSPNFILTNDSSEKALCYIEKANWKDQAIMASEVSSSLDFKTLFAKETLKETSKVKASNVTMLFTDLMNSTEIYVQEGDESAIGRVLGHFNIIQQIIAEERGGIVKTIGDSVMAVFKEPVSALKAIKRIQQIFSTSTSVGDSFKIKAGIHFGDCTAVNLNGRIDYFGTTVNVASRLVDAASEKEIMISEAVFDHPDVKLYLEKNTDTFFVRESLKELKGFADEEFKVKQIRLERPPMRLVI